jgi:hypothetical protein
MTTQVKSALKELASVSQSLNQVSDELSAQLAEIEKAINRYNLGVTAWVTLRSTEMEPEVGQFPWSVIDELRYTKLEGKWGLVWVSYVAEDPENTWKKKSLRESPRDIRLLSVKKLPDLLSELARKAAELSLDTSERVVEARNIAVALNEQS